MSRWNGVGRRALVRTPSTRGVAAAATAVPGMPGEHPGAADPEPQPPCDDRPLERRKPHHAAGRELKFTTSTKFDSIQSSNYVAIIVHVNTGNTLFF